MNESTTRYTTTPASNSKAEEEEEEKGSYAAATTTTTTTPTMQKDNDDNDTVTNDNGATCNAVDVASSSPTKSPAEIERIKAEARAYAFSSSNSSSNNRRRGKRKQQQHQSQPIITATTTTTTTNTKPKTTGYESLVPMAYIEGSIPVSMPTSQSQSISLSTSLSKRMRIGGGKMDETKAGRDNMRAANASTTATTTATTTTTTDPTPVLNIHKEEDDEYTRMIKSLNMDDIQILESIFHDDENDDEEEWKFTFDNNNNNNDEEEEEEEEEEEDDDDEGEDEEEDEEEEEDQEEGEEEDKQRKKAGHCINHTKDTATESSTPSLTATSSPLDAATTTATSVANTTTTAGPSKSILSSPTHPSTTAITTTTATLTLPNDVWDNNPMDIDYHTQYHHHHDDSNDDDDDDDANIEDVDAFYKSLEEELGSLLEEDLEAAVQSLYVHQNHHPLHPPLHHQQQLLQDDNDEELIMNDTIQPTTTQTQDSSNPITAVTMAATSSKKGSQAVVQETATVSRTTTKTISKDAKSAMTTASNKVVALSTDTTTDATKTDKMALATTDITKPKQKQQEQDENDDILPTTPNKDIARRGHQTQVTHQQSQQLRRLLQRHYQILIQQAILSIRAAQQLQRPPLSQQQSKTISSSSSSSKQTSCNDDKDETHFFLSSETDSDLAEVLDLAVNMLQDLDQNRKDSIRTSIQLAMANGIIGSNNNNNNNNQSSSSSNNDNKNNDNENKYNNKNTSRQYGHDDNSVESGEQDNDVTSSSNKSLKGRRSLFKQFADDHHDTVVNTTDQDSTSKDDVMVTMAQQEQQPITTTQRLTRAAFRRLQAQPIAGSNRTAFDIPGLMKLKDTFITIDRSVNVFSMYGSTTTTTTNNIDRDGSSSNNKGKENEDRNNIDDNNNNNDVSGGNILMAPTHGQACKDVLIEAGSYVDESLLPGVADLSDNFSSIQEIFGETFVPPCSTEQECFLRKNRNLFTSGEDNLVLRGVNLYGEKQWILIADRYLPDRSINIISQRYSKLCVMIYMAHGIHIGQKGHLQQPPKLESVDDIDEEKVKEQGLTLVEPPAILNVHRWSLEEDLTLLKAVPIMGHMWAELGARLIPHRDRGHLRKRYQVLERRVKATINREAKAASRTAALRGDSRKGIKGNSKAPAKIPVRAPSKLIKPKSSLPLPKRIGSSQDPKATSQSLKVATTTGSNKSKQYNSPIGKKGSQSKSSTIGRNTKKHTTLAVSNKKTKKDSKLQESEPAKAQKLSKSSSTKTNDIDIDPSVQSTAAVLNTFKMESRNKAKSATVFCSSVRERIRSENPASSFEYPQGAYLSHPLYPHPAPGDWAAPYPPSHEAWAYYSHQSNMWGYPPASYPPSYPVPVGVPHKNENETATRKRTEVASGPKRSTDEYSGNRKTKQKESEIDPLHIMEEVDAQNEGLDAVSTHLGKSPGPTATLSRFPNVFDQHSNISGLSVLNDASSKQVTTGLTDGTKNKTEDGGAGQGLFSRVLQNTSQLYTTTDKQVSDKNKKNNFGEVEGHDTSSDFRTPKKKSKTDILSQSDTPLAFTSPSSTTLFQSPNAMLRAGAGLATNLSIPYSPSNSTVFGIFDERQQQQQPPRHHELAEHTFLRELNLSQNSNNSQGLGLLAVQGQDVHHQETVVDGGNNTNNSLLIPPDDFEAVSALEALSNSPFRRPATMLSQQSQSTPSSSTQEENANNNNNDVKDNADATDKKEKAVNDDSGTTTSTKTKQSLFAKVVGNSRSRTQQQQQQKQPPPPPKKNSPTSRKLEF